MRFMGESTISMTILTMSQSVRNYHRLPQKEEEGSIAETWIHGCCERQLNDQRWSCRPFLANAVSHAWVLLVRTIIPVICF